MIFALCAGSGCAWIKSLTRTGKLRPTPAPSSASPITGRPLPPQKESELQSIFTADNTALTEIAGWIEENKTLIRTDPARRERLAQRIRMRLDRVRKLYIAFLEKNPDNARARAAYGSFLAHLDDQQGALRELKASAELAPFNAAVQNNIATHLGTLAVESRQYTRVGELLEAYQKSIRLAPRKPLYRHNYAIALSLFQKQAAAHLKCKPREVTGEALKQITEALRLDPNNFEIAADLAETHHDFDPIPRENTLTAWQHAATLATTEDEHSWAELQMAIVNIETDHLKEAKQHLEKVNAPVYERLKTRLLNAIENTSSTNNAKP